MRRTVKNTLILLLASVMLFSLALACLAAGQTVNVTSDGTNITVAVNGNQIAFDQQPYIANGRTMVPFRGIAEALGAKVNWDEAANKVTITGDKTVELTIGSTTAAVDGQAVTLDVPAVVAGGRTMVPLRFIGESLGAEVNYSESPAPAVQPAQSDQPAPSGGLLPGEDKIQTSLTQEDIARLQSYPANNEKAQADIAKSPADVQEKFSKYSKNFDAYINPKGEFVIDTTADIMKALKIMQDDLWTVDYQKLENQSYADDYARNYYSVTCKNSDNTLTVNKYIAKSVNNKLKIKTYLLSSNYVIYVASPNYVGVRAKYIFYQSSGTKIEEQGSTLGQWYWQDVELLFVTPLGTWEGNTAGVAWRSTKKLNQPQPYFSN